MLGSRKRHRDESALIDPGSELVPLRWSWISFRLIKQALKCSSLQFGARLARLRKRHWHRNRGLGRATRPRSCSVSDLFGSRSGTHIVELSNEVVCF